MDLNGKIVWITGASSGIGAACAEAFSQAGATPVISARRLDRLEEVRARCSRPDEVVVVPLDVTDEAAREAAVREVIERCGRVDVLVNNAGISQRARAADTSIDVDRRIMELNYFAVIGLTKAVVPHMVEQKSGHLVVVSSVAGFVGTKQRTAYAASKHAVRGYFDSLRAELAERGVGVSIVCPGYVKTEISQSAMRGDGGTFGTVDHNIARGIPASRAANALVSGVRRGRDEVYVGGKEIAAIYLKRWVPGLVARIVRGMPEAEPEG